MRLQSRETTDRVPGTGQTTTRTSASGSVPNATTGRKPRARGERLAGAERQQHFLPDRIVELLELERGLALVAEDFDDRGRPSSFTSTRESSSGRRASAGSSPGSSGVPAARTGQRHLEIVWLDQANAMKAIPRRLSSSNSDGSPRRRICPDVWPARMQCGPSPRARRRRRPRAGTVRRRHAAARQPFERFELENRACRPDRADGRRWDCHTVTSARQPPGAADVRRPTAISGPAIRLDSYRLRWFPSAGKYSKIKSLAGDAPRGACRVMAPSGDMSAAG
jgi:hypothetical protein